MDIPNASESLYPLADNVVLEDKPSSFRCGRAIFEQKVVDRCFVIWVHASVHKFPPTKEQVGFARPRSDTSILHPGAGRNSSLSTSFLMGLGSQPQQSA
jgi:hypothetical protein